MQPTKIIRYSLIFLIILFGFFLRFYNINNTPPGIYPDEAVNGQDAIYANATGNYQWFYPANQGREGLFMNLIAFCFHFFGIGILTLKLPAIFFGTMTIWGVYLLTQELFKKSNLALTASFLYATSFWAINFSRISFRANMLPFVLVFSFYFIFHGIRTKKVSSFIFGGLLFGLGIHTYIAFRIAPLILVFLFLSFILSKKNFIKSYWKHLLFFIATTLLAASPMFYTFYYHPEYFKSRSDHISILSPEINHGHLIQTFLRSFSLSLVKFNFYGDQNWRHGYPPYPVLDPLVSLAFLFGFLYSFVKLFSLLIHRLRTKLRDENLNIYTLLVVWFFAMLVPEFMTAEGLPHALRSIGVLPAVLIMSSLIFCHFIEISKEKSKLYQKLMLTLIIIFILSSGIFNAFKYHLFWAKKDKVGLSFNKNLTDMSKYINTLPKDMGIFVITSYNTIEKAPIEVLAHSHDTLFFYPNELDTLQPKNDNFMIFFTENNVDAIEKLQQKFPQLQLVEIKNDLSSIYYILK